MKFWKRLESAIRLQSVVSLPGAGTRPGIVSGRGVPKMGGDPASARLIAGRVGPDGTVYVSDFLANRIYSLKDGELVFERALSADEVRELARD